MKHPASKDGVHDILAAACDPYRYRRDFGVENHRIAVDGFRAKSIAEVALSKTRQAGVEPMLRFAATSP